MIKDGNQVFAHHIPPLGVCTIDACWQAHMDLLTKPSINLYDRP
jgi:ADP-glucose pyrophosphorylase